MSDGLGHKTISGVRFTMLSTVVTAVSQTASLVILARLLTPFDYGQVAVGMVVISPIQHVLFNGLERAVVLMTGLSADDKAAVTGLNVLLGLAATLLVGLLGLAALAGAKFAIYAPILFALSPLMLVSGLAVSARALLRQNLAYRQLAVADMVSQIAAIAATVAAAWASWGAYSLVFGYTVRALLQTAINIYNSDTDLRVRFAVARIEPIVAASIAISRISIVELLRDNLPTLFIGGSAGPVALGFYNRSYFVIQVPVGLLLTSMSTVLYSTFILVRDDLERLQRGCRTLIEVGSAATVPFAFGIAAAAPQVVRILLGQQWSAVGAILPILCFGSILGMLGSTFSVVSASTGRFPERLVIQIVAAATTAIGLFAAMRLPPIGPLGLTGYCIAVAAGNLIYFASHIVLNARVLAISPLRILSWLLPAVLCGAVLAILVFVLRDAMAGQRPILIFLAEVGTCGLSQLVFYAIFCRRILFDIVRFSGVPFPSWLMRFQPG